MALLSPPPKMQFFGNNGLPLSGGKVYTYEKDTTVPLATYTDSTGSVANANPVILDAQGRADIWLQILPYSFVIYSSLDVLQSCSGPIEFPSAALSGSDIAAWSDIVVYDFPDQVAGSDGYTYRCVGTNVLDDDPVGSVTGNWVNLSSLASAALTGTPTAPTAAAGTNTTQIATTAFVKTAIDNAVGPLVQDSEFTGTNQSKTAAGYQKLPGGLILQWGSVANQDNLSGNVAITFPVAFPTALLHFTASANDTLTTLGSTVMWSSPTTTNIQVATGWVFNNSTSKLVSFTWFAIGH